MMIDRSCVKHRNVVVDVGYDLSSSPYILIRLGMKGGKSAMTVVITLLKKNTVICMS